MVSTKRSPPVFRPRPRPRARARARARTRTRTRTRTRNRTPERIASIAAHGHDEKQNFGGAVARLAMLLLNLRQITACE